MRTLLAIAIGLALMVGSAFAQSSSGYPYPGCTVFASTTGGDGAGHVKSLLITPPSPNLVVSLCQLSGYNNAGSTRYIDLFTGSACPATGTVPLMEVTVATDSMFSEAGLGEAYASGIAICVSTTEGSFTATSTNDAYIRASITK